MKDNKSTYTLWNGDQQIASYSHTREGYDAALEAAHNLYLGGYGSLAVYSSRDDLVWKSTQLNDEPNEPNDVWHDADALASAGYGTDEDYGCYGPEDCWD